MVTEEELIKGWYLKRTPVTGSEQSFISLCEWEVVLGRFTCCSPHISREHVLFQKTESDDVFIKDLKSVNGTFVNGTKIKSEYLYPIRVGDRIALGKEIIKYPMDFEFELCFTKQPLKLIVTKTLPVKKCAALKPRENRRHSESRRCVAENSDVTGNAPYPESCSENDQLNRTSRKVVSTLNQPSSSGNVTRACTARGCSKRPGSQLGESSRHARKKLHSSEENSSISGLEKESVTSRICTPLEIDITQDNPQIVVSHFRKEIVQEKSIKNHIDHQTTENESVTARKGPPLEIDKTLGNLQKEDYHFGKEVVQEKPIRDHIDHRTTEGKNATARKVSPLEIGMTLLDNYLSGKVVKQENPVENHIDQTKVNDSANSGKCSPIEIDLTIESHTDHQAAENESITARKGSQLEIDQTLGNMQAGDYLFGKAIVQEKSVEKDSDNGTVASNTVKSVKKCFVKMTGSDELVKSYMQKNLHRRRKDSKKTVLSLSSSESDEESASFVEREAENVSLKSHNGDVLCSDVDNEVSFVKQKHAQDSVTSKHRNKFFGSELYEEDMPGSREDKRKSLAVIDSDDEADKIPPGIESCSKDVLCSDGNDNSYVKRKHAQNSITGTAKHRNKFHVSELYEEDTLGIREAKRKSLAVIDSDDEADEITPGIESCSKDVLCSDGNDNSYVKLKHAQDSITGKHRKKFVGRELYEEDTPGSREAKRKCLPIINSDEEPDEMPPSIEKSLCVNAGRQSNTVSGDATDVNLHISSRSESDETLLSSYSCNETKLTNNCSDSLTEGGDKESSIGKVGQHIKKEPCDDTDKSRGQQGSDDDDSNDCFMYSQVDEVIVVSSDEDDDIGVVYSSKFSNDIHIKLEPKDPKTELELGDSKINSDSVYNHERSATAAGLSEYELTRFQWTEDPDENDYSDFWPELSQSLNDIEEDEINEPQQDEASIPGSSKAKLSLEEMNHNRMEVTATSVTEALPNICHDDDDLRVIFSTKSSGDCVQMELNDLPVHNEVKLDDAKSTRDSLDNTERLKKAVPEHEHTKFYWTDDPGENDVSSFWPELSQSFNDVEEDETSIPGPSKEKLEELIHRDRKRKVTTTTFTEPLPNTERRQRRNGRVEAAAQKEVYGNKSDKWISKRRHLPTEVRNSKLKPIKGHDIRKRIQVQQGHRIRMPGGGSAIRCAPSSVASGGARILGTTTAKLQINQIQPPLKSKVDKPIPILPGTKKAPKLTTEQRFRSRQEVLTDELTRKTVPVSPNKVGGKSRLSEFKIPRKPKPVQNVKTSQTEEKSSEMKNYESAHKVTSSAESDDKHLGDSSRLLHRPSILKNTSNASKPRVTFAEKPQILEIPNNETEKAALKSRNVPDRRLLKMTNNPNLKNTSSLAPKLTPSDRFHNVKAIHKILTWRTVWLKEQQQHTNSKKTPPVVDEKLLREVSLSYTSYDEYCNTYYPLLMLEIWASIYKDWNSKNKSCVKMCINHYSMKDNLWELHCQAVILNGTPFSAKTLMEGHLVIIPLRIIGTNEARPVFGYVTEYRNESLAHIGNAVPPLICKIAENSRYGRLVTCIIKVATRSLTLDLSQLVKVEPITNIRPKLRQMDAIFALNCSGLVQDIFCPRRQYFVVDHKADARLLSLGRFNHLQEEAILGAADAISQPYAIPQIRLFQGPPGTGKTSMIIGLIQQILHPSSGGNQKLLVVSSSNGAVDEIARRLIQIRPDLKKAHPSWKCRLVRVGITSEIQPDVKCIFIDELASNNLVNKPDSDISIKQKIESEDKIICDLQQQLESTSPADIPKRSRLETEKISHLKQLHFYRNQLRNGKGKQMPHYQSPAFKKQVREILKNADVILSTINSSRQSILEQTFGKKESPIKFTCCIVDEATQCTEPELLTPLQYGISKLILVGDPKQLPATVLCQKAEKLGFNVSFFERVFKFFQRNCDVSPVLMLAEQYRMHSQIVKFPSQHFYAKKLCTPQILDRKYSSFPLKPYVCIDMPEGKENTSNVTNIRNPYEAILVTKLCEILLQIIPRNCSVGIITFYSGQREELAKLLNLQEGSSKLNSRVEIQCVDGFQGREKDVIILSCVRTESSIGFMSKVQRMNVAITRARQCLIVCGNLKLLHQHAHWKELIDDAFKRDVVINMTTADSISSVVNRLKKDACR